MHPIRPRFVVPQVRCAKSTIPRTMSDIRVLVLLLFVCIFQGPRFTPNTSMCVCVCVNEYILLLLCMYISSVCVYVKCVLHVYAYMYICMYGCMYVCVCVCVCVYHIHIPRGGVWGVQTPLLFFYMSVSRYEDLFFFSLLVSFFHLAWCENFLLLLISWNTHLNKILGTPMVVCIVHM